MQMSEITFDSVPKRILQIEEKVDQLLLLISNQSSQEEPERWFTMDGIRVYLGDEENPIPRQTIYEWTRKGKIPHSKKGKRLYFSKRAIDQWLSGGR